MAELAKIVSGRPTGPTNAGRRSAPAANETAKPPTGGDAISDLEAELLSDLQASFAVVRDMAASPPPTTRPQPPPPPTPEKREPVRAEIEPEPVFTSPELPRQSVPLSADPFIVNPIFTAPEPPELPAAAPAVERVVRAEPREDWPAQSAAQTPLSPPEQANQADRASRSIRPPLAAGDKPDLGGFQLRASAAPANSTQAPPVAPARQPHSRWEQPEPAKPHAIGVSRFAPPRSAKAVAPPPEVFEDEELDPFADGGLFAEKAAPAESTEDAGADFSLDHLGLAPAYGDDDEPVYPGNDLESLVKPRRSRGLILVGSVLGVVLVGGIAVAMFRPSATDTATPPVIAANGEPTKITPDDTAAADADAQNKLIYDRVNSGEANADTTLLTPGDEPIAEVPSDVAADNPISRVIIPGGPGVDAPATDDALQLDGQLAAVANPDDGSTQVAANDPAVQAIGPRKVRTVIVKPDGTIVESSATDAGAAADAETASGAPGALMTGAATPPAIDLPRAPVVTDDTTAIAGNDTSGELSITPVPEAGGADVAAVDNPPPVAPDPPAAQVAEAPAKPVVKPAPQTVVANNDASGPIDLNQPADDQQQAPAASGGVLVQVSSQKSEDSARATFRDLQARYPSILGRYDVNIQRAEVQDRGTFYRVRVGPFSAGDAQRLCDDLKSAGGDCVLAKR